jgi:hypothetical protein
MPALSSEFNWADHARLTVLDGHGADMLDVHLAQEQVIHGGLRSTYQIVLILLLQVYVLVAYRCRF